MSTIVTRAGKGSALTFAEMDANFTNLNTDKLEQNLDSLQFDTTSTDTGAVGKLVWNDTDGTLDLGLKGGNVTLQIGQEQLVHVLNNTGTAFTDAQVVRVTGASGQRLTASLAQADNPANYTNTLALVTEPIANNQSGFATTTGIIHNVDTSSFAEGAALYLSSTVAGGLTTTAPANIVRVGWCVRSHATLGQIYVNIDAQANLTGYVTETGTQTLTNKTLTLPVISGYTETQYSLSGTDLAVSNGTVQYKTLSGNTTFTESLADGQGIILMLNPSTYTATWPTTTWIGTVASTAPTLIASVYNCLVFFQMNGTLYGRYIGRV